VNGPAKENTVPPDDVTPESEARWQEWLAKGRARESRTRHRMRMSLLGLLSAATLAAALVLALM
jgi:hypothetical protein